MTEALIEQHLVKLLKNFDSGMYIDYMTKISQVSSSYGTEFQLAGITPLESIDLAGKIGFRGKFEFSIFVLLSHPICRFRSHRNYQLGMEPFFTAHLGLVPVFFSSLNQMTVLKLWGNRTSEFFNPSNEPLHESDIVCWEFPAADMPMEYSSLNFIEQNRSRPEDAGLYLTGVFDKYFRLIYWLFPRHGFSPSPHFMYGRDHISSAVKVSKSLFLVEKIENPESLSIEGSYIETRQILVRGLNEQNGRFFFEYFSALMDRDLADEIMLRNNPESSFINGILVELTQTGGRRNSVITLKADYALSTYDIVQSLIGIVSTNRYRVSSGLADIADIDDIREGVANLLYEIKRDIVMPSTISDTINDLFGICLSQMFPVLLIDCRRVKMVHPLMWGFLKKWNLLKEDTNQQKQILVNLLRVMESDKGFPANARSDEMEVFGKMGINKRDLLRSILYLKRMITIYRRINCLLEQ